MARKAASGFSAQGGGQPRATRAAGYSEGEMLALSKMNPNPAFSGQVVLCDCCGRPISSGGPYDQPGTVYPYDAQANFPHEPDSRGKPRGYGRHFMCNATKIQKLQADLSAKYEALPEDERARQFNDGTPGPPPPTGKPAPYAFRPGELPLAKVQAAGGVSKLAPVVTPPAPAVVRGPTLEDDAHDARQSAATETRLRAELAAELAILRGETPPDYSAHDRAAATADMLIEVGDDRG